MGKFNKTGKREMPALNTSSLPDLIFTLLFFFMIVTTMREVTLKVQFQVPQGTELEKLEKKSLVTFIYIGKPTDQYRAKMGSESRIQLNDSYAEVGEVQDFIFQERSSMREDEQAMMTVSLKKFLLKEILYMHPLLDQSLAIYLLLEILHSLLVCLIIQTQLIILIIR